MRRVVLALACAAVALRSTDTATSIRVASATLERVPLVVVLHGDREGADDSERRWGEAVEKRGWELLALECPKDLGCRGGSWYRWDGDPEWVRERVVETIQDRRIDPSRIFIVGWSGGATYIGKHLQSWSPLFAAAVIHGGGVPPVDDACPDRELPTYFLVGDENPAHGAAKRLRAYLEACDQELEWDLVPGANHAKEDAALTADKADEILDWLDRHPRALETS
jgi:poly(3-hydroxybutyrate) depolymerase